MAAGSPEAVLESGVIERAGRNLWIVARETEELSLLAPVMRQVLGQPQEPRQRQLDWLTAHDARSQIGQSNKRGEAAISDSEAFGHGSKKQV